MQFIKKLIPKFLLQFIRPYYHGALALLANYYFDEPSKNMVVIGVTGTAGKSTTVQMLAWILDNAESRGNEETRNHAESKKTGFITTVSFYDGNTEFINKHGLSMPGGWLLHKQLKQMLKNGCKYAVVECTSEGLAQNRHLGIDFDYALFTNLSPAHTEAHGGFENYKAAKSKLFASLGTSQTGVAKKTIVANLDNEFADYFLSFSAQQKFGVSFFGKNNLKCQKTYLATKSSTGFILNNQSFTVHLVGDFNHYNALLAVAAANGLGVGLADCAKALDEFKFMRGRMESVPNNRGMRIFVDYGCEPASFEAASKAAHSLPHQRLIHVFGSTGGHRDTSKRAVFGKVSAEFADYIIITNDDVYDSDPERIISDIEAGIVSSKPFTLNPIPYEKILDRRHAIHRALSIAEKDDLVLITGKGSEQFLVLPGNKRIVWDEVEIVKEELNKHIY